MSDDVIVTLTVQEMMVGAQVGVMRNMSAITNKRPDRYGYDDENPWETDIVSSQAELAVCKYLNLYWSGLPRFGVDVGDIVDVRCVKSDSRRLILHESDSSDVPWVSVLLVDRKKMDFKLRGWVFGREGKIKDNWKDPTGKDRWAFFVENSELHSMKSLCDWVNANRPALK